MARRTLGGLDSVDGVGIWRHRDIPVASWGIWRVRSLNRRIQGQLIIRAPAQAGRYDLRMHDTDAKGREITHVTFEVR